MAYSQLQYGILAWGNANKTNLSPLNKVHNGIIKMIQEKENFQTNLLNIKQIYKLEIGKFMFRYNANQLPTSFIKYFTSIHSYPTRLSKQQNYFLPRYRLQQSQKLISYTGAKLWSEIPENIKKIFLQKFF